MAALAAMAATPVVAKAVALAAASADGHAMAGHEAHAQHSPVGQAQMPCPLDTSSHQDSHFSTRAATDFLWCVSLDVGCGCASGGA